MLSRGRTETAELQQQHQHVTRIEKIRLKPDPNPKKRLLVKSASAAASGIGQQHVKRSATDAERDTQIGVPMEMGTDESAALPSAFVATTRQIIAETSAPVAVPQKGT